MRVFLCLFFLGFLMALPVSARAGDSCTPKDLAGAMPKVWATHGDSAQSRPACADLIKGQFSLYVTLTGQLAPATADNLLRRFGAVSALHGLPYWSFSEGRRETLIRDAVPVSGTGEQMPASDFALSDMKNGSDLFFRQTDNRSASGVIYRMRVLEHAQHRLLIAVENTSPVKFLFMTLFQPGDLQTVYLLEQAKDRTWRYYNLSGIRGSSWATGSGSEKSYMSRALSMFAHFAGHEVADVPPTLDQKA
jgi:hypothetical protein